MAQLVAGPVDGLPDQDQRRGVVQEDGRVPGRPGIYIPAVTPPPWGWGDFWQKNNKKKLREEWGKR